MMIVACFTSTPESMLQAEKSIKSILGQSRRPDIIRWHLPIHCVRLNVEYPPIPEWFDKYRNDIELVRCDDVGPSTKFYSILDTDLCPLEISDSSACGKGRGSTSILIFDDDALYPASAIETLLEARNEALDKKVAVGFSGVCFRYIPFTFSNRKAFGSKTGLHWYNKVSVLLGSGMILMPSSAINISKKKYLDIIKDNDHYYKNDDMVIAHLAYRNKVDMYTVALPQNESITFHTQNETRLKGTNRTGLLNFKMSCDGKLSWFHYETVLISICIILFIVYIRKR